MPGTPIILDPPLPNPNDPNPNDGTLSCPTPQPPPPPPPPGGFSGSFTTLAWGNLTNTSDSGGYINYTSGGTPCGGIATTAVDASQPFQVQLTADSDAVFSAIVVYLDDDNTADFVWQGSLTFIMGVYQYGGSLYAPVGGYAATGAGSFSGTNVLFRYTKSGNDLVISMSTNGGSSFATVATGTGVLAGKTTTYLKALFAAPGSGQRVKAELRTS